MGYRGRMSEKSDGPVVKISFVCEGCEHYRFEGRGIEAQQYCALTGAELWDHNFYNKIPNTCPRPKPAVVIIRYTKK